MAAVAGSITSVSLLKGPSGNDGEYVYSCLANFAVYTAADVATLTGVAATIQSATKKGRTVTLRRASAGSPGRTAAGAKAYAHQIFTVDGSTIECHLGSVSADANTAACTDVEIIVTVTES